MNIAFLIRRYKFFLVNSVYAGTSHFEKKRKILMSLGYKIGSNTKIVGPVYWDADVEIGDNCWIGKNMSANGNGKVIIGNNCDIAPDVVFQTGSHDIGTSLRRAGEGRSCIQSVGNGCWIGLRASVIGDTHIGDGVVVAACSCVVKEVEENTLVGGVPAKRIRSLDNE